MNEIRVLSATGILGSGFRERTLKRNMALMPGYEVILWYGIFAPAATPREIVQRLNAEIGKAQNAPDVRERFAALGLTAVHTSPEQFDKFFRAEIEKWGKVVKAAGLKAE